MASLRCERGLHPASGVEPKVVERASQTTTNDRKSKHHENLHTPWPQACRAAKPGFWRRGFGSAIPKRFNPIAQGCRLRETTLGPQRTFNTNLEGVESIRPSCTCHVPFRRPAPWSGLAIIWTSGLLPETTRYAGRLHDPSKSRAGRAERRCSPAHQPPSRAG